MPSPNLLQTMPKINIIAPTTASIYSVDVEAGSKVKKDDPLMILESMKMLIDIFSPCDGKVFMVKVQVGEIVSQGSTLVVLEN